MACQKNWAPPIGLDIGKLEANIHHELEGKVVGYGWAAYRDGELISSGGKGWARAEGYDSDPSAYTANTSSTIFSTTKTITAASFIENLEEWGISLEDKIWNYLPAAWTKDRSLSNVTFKQLLKHTSGLDGTFDRYTQMRNQVANVGLTGTIGDWNYANINYTLFRVLIPNIMNSNMVDQKIQESDQAIVDYCAYLYENFVSTKMAKAGMPGFQYISTNYLEALPKTLYYNFNTYKNGPSTNAKGQLMFDCHDISGAGGWFMSPVQYAAFIDGLFNNKLLDAPSLQTMKDEQLGMFPTTGKYGTYYTHSGSGGWGTQGKGGQSIWMHYPRANVSLFITWNSLNNDLSKTRRALIKDVFDEAYTD